uniref:Uncharacterized protein n=1 Tax=Pipistrellus kuhlii TaxID=59472 RepID=A0A7J7TLN3_PIPKU|nr:hypothetical protein mPipKuh1_009347 [Pipistrellus kuhlii]
MDKRQSSCNVGENADWCNHCGKQYRVTSKNKNWNCLMSAIPFLGIYPKKPKTLTQKNICILMLTNALLTTRGLVLKIMHRGGGCLSQACTLWQSRIPQQMSDCQLRPDPAGIPPGSDLNSRVRHPLIIWDCWLLTAHMPA